MIWTFVILIVGYVIYKFFNSLEEDKDDLNNQKLSEKFNAIINMLNDAAFNGKGDINIEDNRNLNIYENDSNQIIELQYSTGSLSITWKYKYYQKEVVYKKNFPESRNLSIFDQKKIAELVISQMSELIKKHKSEVLGIDNESPQNLINNIEQNPLNVVIRETQLVELKEVLNSSFVHPFLSAAIEFWPLYPDSLKMSVIDKDVQECEKEILDSYDRVKRKFEEDYGIFFFSKSEYLKIGMELMVEFINNMKK